MIDAAIIGGAGYAGAELIRVLAQHPDFDVKVVTSDADAGEPIADVYPALTGVEPATFSPHNDPAVLTCDVAFLAVPHRAGMQHAPHLAAAGVAVVDLSADFRLPQDVYEQTYKVDHAAPDLLANAVYGQPELNHAALEALAETRAAGKPAVIGCAGCYPTAVSIAAVPAVRAGMVSGTVIADCVSGVTGAGKKSTSRTHFCSANDNVDAYGLPQHRHEPEMAMELAMAAAQGAAAGSGNAAQEPIEAPQVLFTPHLAPLNRGMIATVHLPLAEGVTAESLRAVYERAYAESPFVTLLPEGKLPRTASVVGTNNAHVGVFPDRTGGYATVISVIDNLGKGAADQAVQCANILFGLDETSGLTNLAMPI